MNGHYIQEIISSSVRMGALDCMIENYSNPFLEIFFAETSKIYLLFIWLILPVVIHLSKRLSHVCLCTSIVLH